MKIYKLVGYTNCGFYTTEDKRTNTMIAYEKHLGNIVMVNIYNKGRSFTLAHFHVYGNLKPLKDRIWK